MTKTPPPPQNPALALEKRTQDAERLFSPSAAKNRRPILGAFQELMPTSGNILEIASGTGEHGAYICGAIPGLHWHPSDPDTASRRSITAWSQTISDGRMKAPLNIAADHEAWWQAQTIPQTDGLVSINMIHIAPIQAAHGLFQGARQLLPSGKRLFLYGPFKRRGKSAPSNFAFDADLKRRNPAWGVRDLDDQIIPYAALHGMRLAQVQEMPGNNLSVVFEKA